jgi:hypothetical protein
MNLEIKGIKITMEAWSIWKKLIGMKERHMSWRVFPMVPRKLATERRKELKLKTYS